MIDLLAGVGLVLPALLQKWRRITVYAAWGIIVLMVAVSVFLVARGEVASIGVNVFFGLLAVLVAWGRRSWLR
ncbi:hypothetical protein HHL16_24340 [Pseudoflavitalea sp. G-6-1-2]|nr:hypothetical protein [Pseudoflavitalea sp. G-6-1-2]